MFVNDHYVILFQSLNKSHSEVTPIKCAVRESVVRTADSRECRMVEWQILENVPLEQQILTNFSMRKCR